MTSAPAVSLANDWDLLMMQRAIDQARLAWEADEVPVGAVIYRGEEIIASAFNLREADRDPTAHAEMIVLREASRVLKDWRLTDCSLAVTLEPCPMCAGAVINARVGRLIYGASDPKWGAVDSLFNICRDERLNHTVEIIGGVLGPECRGVLRDFFRMRRQQNKEQRRAAAADKPVENSAPAPQAN